MNNNLKINLALMTYFIINTGVRGFGFLTLLYFILMGIPLEILIVPTILIGLIIICNDAGREFSWRDGIKQGIVSVMNNMKEKENG